MKRVPIILVVLLSASLVLWMVATAASPVPDNPTKETPSPSETSEEIPDVEAAIYEKIDTDRQDSIFFWNQSITVEKTSISNDGQWAASVMVPTDPKTGETPETEPALVITIQDDGEWLPLFPNDPGWLEAVENAPEDLLSPEHKEILLAMNYNAAVNMPSAAIRGYLLPWDAGTSYYLTGSTCHDEYVESGNAHYAFDFAYNRTMWDILAAKSGEVWVWKDDVPTCYDWSCWRDQPVGNYIVLRDSSTDPVTYQLYLHLKQDSIPDEIKVRGFKVAQGQFIGIVDNTGQSSGSHLHFQVQVPYLGENHFWGRSVDITFDDVDINGGRPRIQNPSYCLDFYFCDEPGDVCETSQLFYTSQNQRVYPEDSTPPVGDITNLTTGEIFGAMLPVEAWAEDLGDGNSEPSGLHSIQLMAFYNDGWKDIGPEFNSLTVNYDWDWCTDDVPDGPVSVALRLTDNRGNQTPGLPGLTHVIKHNDCNPQLTPPRCQPTSNQVAIFSDINYQGECQLLSKGGYSDSSLFEVVGDNNMESILVGADVQAELFTEPGYLGRTEILVKDDSNMSDNQNASNTLSSIRVSTRTSPTAGSPDFSNTLTMKTSISSADTSFTAPYSDTLEGDTSGWNTSIEGWWHLSEQQYRSASHSWRYGIEATNNYFDGNPNNGILESPLITLPVSSDPYVFQFWYRYETESNYPHWDQRWVQISVDGGEFTNIYQLADDPTLGWMKARIDLLPYYSDMNNEHSVKVRFYFDTIDSHNNNFEGWYIDDFQIRAEPVTAVACPDDFYEPNDLPNSDYAKRISYGVTAEAVICQGWDLDFFRFIGSAGDHVIVDIDAQSIGSNLDSYLFLLDTDGSSELAENDDEILYEKRDPFLTYLLPRDGEYYLKVKAWDHPMGVGAYALKLINDDQNPRLTLTNPVEKSTIPIGNVTLMAEAFDEQSDIQYVQFYYHDDNWETGKWVEIGTDSDGSDGWTTVLDTTAMSDGDTISVYAVAIDNSGNWDHDAAWNVKVDAQPLSAILQDLTNPTQSNAVHLQWSVNGGGSETAIVDIYIKVNDGGWNTLLTNTNLQDYWYIGEAGNNYTFRLTAGDFAGNEVTSQKNTSIPSATTLCSIRDSWDLSASINDNDYSSSNLISVDSGIQVHNFCNPEVADYQNDEDWIHFTAEAGELYALMVNPIGDRSAWVTIQFYAADGTTLLAEKEVPDFGRYAEFYWQATENGTIYVKINHKFNNVVGTGTAYTVNLTNGSIYFPLIKK